MNKRKLIQNATLLLVLVLNFFNLILATSLSTRVLYGLSICALLVYFAIELIGGEHHKRK